MGTDDKALSFSDERLRALTDPGYLQRFVAEYPRAKQLRAGDEDRFLQGALDIHVHADPCSLLARSQDYTQVALDAARAGMRAVVRKDHTYSTVGEADAIQRHIDHLVDTGALENRVQVYGGVPLRFSTDPAVVMEALAFPTFKMIWMNAVNGEVLVGDGRVLPQVDDIIKAARDNGIGITLGAPAHSKRKYAGMDDFEAVLPVAERIAELGARAVLDHPVTSFSADQIQRLCVDGVYAGLFCYPALPSIIKAPVVDPKQTLDVLARVGAEKCVVASDVGTLLEPTTLDSLRLMIRLLLALEVADGDIDRMLKVNPAQVIYLEAP